MLILTVALTPLSTKGAEDAAKAPDHAEERQILQTDLARFHALIVQDNDPVSMTTFRGYHQEYARRASLLFPNFDAKKYEDLRYDINVHCQRLARRLAPLTILPRAQRMEAERSVALHLFNPSPNDPAEVKAALDAVDAAIKRKEDVLGKMTSRSQGHEAERVRLQRIRERRAELGRNFTKAGWDALTGDLKRQ